MEQQIKLTAKEIRKDLRNFNHKWNILICDVQRVKEDFAEGLKMEQNSQSQAKENKQ